MHAVVFDIDGTLLDSFDVDGMLFEQAIATVTGVTDIDTNWGNYRHVTDRGILGEILNRPGSRFDEAIFDAVERELVRLLETHIEAHGAFPEIPGAKKFVARLLADDRYYVAYATGASRGSALTKLRSAGLPIDGITLSTSSDAESRTVIMKNAVEAAPDVCSRISYFGDGQWDQKATGELGWEFVPVGADMGGLVDYAEVGRWLKLGSS